MSKLGIDAHRKTPVQWRFRRKRTTAKNRAEPCFLHLFYAAERLTKTAAKAYISFLRRAAAWRDGASTKPLTVHTVTEHRAMLVAMFASPRRRCGVLRLRFRPSFSRPCSRVWGALGDDGAARFRVV